MGALGSERLLTAQARVLLDLGMGTGKFAMQAFLEGAQLVQVVGVELTQARFRIAARALKRLVAKSPGRFGSQDDRCMDGGKNNCLRLVENTAIGSRTLELRHGDIFELEKELISRADVIIMAVAFPEEIIAMVKQLLGQAKQGCRILTYEDLNLELSHTWDPPAPRAFHQLKCNKSADEYPVSWLPNPGHQFFLHEVGTFQKCEGRRLARNPRILTKSCVDLGMATTEGLDSDTQTTATR